MLKLLSASLLAAGLLSLAACNDPPPTPTAVRAAIATDVAYIVAQTNAASTGAALPSTAALSLLGGFGSSSVTSLPGLSTFAAMMPKHVSVTTKSRLAADSGQVDPQSIIDYLDNNLFTDANSLGNGIFTVPASLACTVTDVDSSGTSTDSLDPQCVAKFTAADVRIRVEQNDETLTFALQLDADHDEPVSVTLSHDAVGLAVDLDNADHAMIALASIFAETPPNVRLAGAVSANLTILGAAHARASFGIDRDVAIAVADQGQDLDGPKATKINSVAATILALELDGTAHAGSADLALGASTAQIPTDTDAMALDLPGATAHASFGNGPLTITGIGLGDRTTTLTKDGQRALAIDLDPADGRTLDATIAADGTLSVTPKLDLRIATDRALLGDDGAPPFDITQVLLTGALAPNGDGVKVVSGSFSIATNPASFGIVATAGQCVADTEVSDATSGAFYNQWMTATCQ